MDLQGKVAFITGSANGLGKGFAEALLQKGAKVFLIDIDESAGMATLADFHEKFGSQNVRFMKLDITNNDQFEAVFKAAVDAFGQVDIMVNNAGVLNEGAWEPMIAVNVTGAIRGAKIAERHMRKDMGGKGGRIVCTSSQAGLSEYFILPVYTATKHAIRSYTISQAAQYDLKAQGIEYAVICPNPVDTNMAKGSDPNRVHHFEIAKKLLSDMMPISRVVDAFMDLIQLETMNGAILKIEKEEITYRKMEAIDLGPNYADGSPTY